ncbi:MULTISPECIES: cryptochrome/photolyase family protein [unclassified Sphingobacterium]|uniref:cryptochrome/photolyase family protein n=1 Tax=unclassified Sphingobacterium TaxID=2609468 RepID=UPI0025E5ABD4|nr:MULTISPECIES: deoxyribodipyrimidine photo-lyase [unclassified Sphingobacterium]
MEKIKVTIFWFRRDLRLDDNSGLARALTIGIPVLPIFIFDEEILEQLEDKGDRRLHYIHQALTHINAVLQESGASLNTFYGKPINIFKDLAEKFDIQGVYCNRDYEPKAIRRDKEIFEYCKSIEIPFKAIKDQVIFDKGDILKNDGTPYTVYTPYAKKWREKLSPDDYRSYTYGTEFFFQQKQQQIIPLKQMGFLETDLIFEEPHLDASIIDHYDETRDYPALTGTTKLGIALRFGTISVRKCVAFALKHNATWLSELIWREFFMQILYHYPHVVTESFRKQYDTIPWRNDEEEFLQWCKGETGYPMVDAGMRQLNTSGYMHNRVRMVVASFLCKHLLVDWRWGEAYFAQKLNDYDLSANNGNWQWAAGSGCDAAPYFRVFNPALQAEKFDKNQEYIKKWVPELGTADYCQPMVDHQMARDRAIKTYSTALK